MEAAIIVSVLLSFVEQLMLTGKLSASANTSDHTDTPTPERRSSSQDDADETNPLIRRTRSAVDGLDQEERTKRLIARMKVQVWAGTGAGLLIATAIGAAFIAVVSHLSLDLAGD